MITLRCFTNPEGRDGYLCKGIVNTDSDGAGTITIKGTDVSSKVVGFSACCSASATDKSGYAVNIVSIVYSAGITTITINASYWTDAVPPVATAFDGDVHYSFWIDVEPGGLPSDLTTNDTTIQEY